MSDSIIAYTYLRQWKHWLHNLELELRKPNLSLEQEEVYIDIYKTIKRRIKLLRDYCKFNHLEDIGL